MEETRKIGDYSVKYSMYIGHKDIALGENPNADKDERYMCCFVETNAIFERYSGVLVSDDFAEIAKVFGQRVADAAEEIIQENERACQEVGMNEELTTNSCKPISYEDSIENKVVVVKGSILRPEFKAEFDEVINSLREEGDILHNRRALAKYCYCTPQSRMQEEPGYYGVRVDTEKYAYLLRLNPDRGEYNLYCYCYRRDWLDQHLKDAEKGIRFIDSHYKELFRIPDGGKVNIHYSWNEEQVRTCRYIDDYHVEIGSNLYHICEFAERMEYGGHTCEPIRDNLPEQCYSVLSGSDEIIIIKRGEKGYFKTNIPVTDKDEAWSIVNEYNTKLGVSKAQEEAMKAGSMFGFQVPAADPGNYDADGKPVMPEDRGDTR